MVNELTNVIDKNTKNKNFSYLKSHPLNYLWLEKRKEKKKSYKKKQNKINILVPKHPKKERKKHDATPTLGV